MNHQHETLHRRFKYFGAKHLEFRQKCIGLLPTIFKEKIYEKKGFNSIFEYAAKLAGLRKKQVKLALSLNEKFKDKPALKSLFENGEVGMYKLARIASIATTENQQFLADQARLLSKSAIETLVRDEQYARKMHHEQQYGMTTNRNVIIENKNGLFESLFSKNFLPGQKCDDQTDDPKSKSSNELNVQQSKNSQDDGVMAKPLEIIKLKLTHENLQELLNLQEKGIDINELLHAFLKNLEEEIEEEKEKLSKEAQPTESRYIKIAVKRIIKKEQGIKCSMQNCHKTAVEIHHQQRFALSKIHDPKYLAQFCKGHHELAHSIDVKFHEVRWSSQT